MTGRAISYSAEERDWIRTRATAPRRAMHAEFVATFARPDVTLKNLNSLCKREGWLTGRNGRFPKGNVPSNKGRTGYAAPGSEKGWFTPGAVPANCKPLFSERIGKDGHIEIKVPLPNPYTGHATRYMHKHRYLWEQANGPLPKGHALKCLDGNRHNTDPANWQAVPRALLPRLNGRFGRGYDAAPTELRPVILATVELEHAVRVIRTDRTQP
jgi:hypothetical protein